MYGCIMRKAIRISFLISGVMAFMIDQSYRGFGERICNGFENPSQSYISCRRHVELETENGFAGNWLWLYFLSYMIVRQITKH